MSKSVRNAIAAFEAQNEIVRKATPPASPARGAGAGAEGGDLNSMMSPTSSLGGDMDHIPFDIPFEASSRRSDIGSVTSDHSATDRAALSRRNRLQQAVHGSSSPQSVEFSPKPTVSLVERRKARQQRNEQLMNKRSSSKGLSRRSTSGSGGERESRHTPQSNPPPRSQPRQLPDPLILNRRFVHSISAESDGPDESPRSQLSPAHRAKQQRMRSTDDDDTQYNSVLTVDHTDDDATQTSVRQIMTSSQPSNQFSSMSWREQQQLQQQVDVMCAASSSSLETDTRQVLYSKAATSSRSSLPPRADDDDTLDYADLNDDDNSVKYEQRRKEGEGRRNEIGFIDGQVATSPLVNKDDMEHYRRSLDTPVVKTAAGIAVAATLGSILLGPVGLLVGAATVGIGVGVMQIPDEQRANMKDRAKKTLHDAQDSALNASEALSSSCATQCRNHGMADQLPNEMKHYFTHEDAHNTSVDQHSMNQSAMERQRSDKGGNMSIGSGGGHFATPQEGNLAPAASGGPGRNRRVACLRTVRITPVDQIHGLTPNLQPRAWLEVLASANTTPDEKSEAMEEILIVAKDKRHARILLEEGILDSLLFMLNRYFDKLQRGAKPDMREMTQVKLAANCCLTLGKAHCAAVHTEGDLLLMSMYERGTVPEERQLAQMLYEVPHHILSKEPDIFVIQQTSMSAAEELANSIKDLATGG